MNKRVPVAEARAYLRDLVQDVHTKQQRVKLTRYGKTVAWIIPKDDGLLLDECEHELQACRRRRSQGRSR